MQKSDENKKLLIDMHAHSSGISECCRIPIDEVLRVAKDTGLDGVILTNHYSEKYADASSPDDLARRYVDEYLLARELGDSMGLTVLFGIELTVSRDPKLHILIYGVPFEFLYENPTLYALSQAELYALVHEWGGAVVQAHPYRGGVDRLQDTALLDGIEINCHPLYEGTHFEKIVDIAHGAGLILTCGADYHADTRRARCGVYLPTDISNENISKFLLSADSVRLLVNEVDTTDTYEYEYERKGD